MGFIRRFTGTEGRLDWAGVDREEYEDPGIQGVSVRWLIGPDDGAPNFAMRYYEIEPGGQTSSESHAHDHGVLVLRGRGEVLLGKEAREIGCGDAVYVPPYELHRFTCTGDEPLGFLCVIPPRARDRR